MQAWDDDNVDIDRLCTRIINGVLHHPAQRDQGEDGASEARDIMFRCVEQWWNDMDDSQKEEYRRKLSRSGVERGENHKEGVQDTGHGHGCSGKLGMHKQFANNGPQTMEDKIAEQAAGAIIGGLTGGISDIINEQTGGKVNMPTSDRPTQGGGLLGAASSLLSGAFSSGETDTYESRPERTQGGGVSQTTEQYGRSSDGRRFEQAEYTDTRYNDGREEQKFERYEQRQDNHGQEHGYRYEERTETYGSQRRTEERRWEGNDDNEGRFGGGFGGGRRDDSNERRGGGYGGGRERRDSDERRGGGGFGGGRRDDSNERHGGGRRDEPEFGGGFGGGRERRDSDERRGGGGFGGGRREEQEYGGGRRDEPGGYGGGFPGGGPGFGEGPPGGFPGGDNEYGEERRGGGWGGGRERRDSNERRGW